MTEISRVIFNPPADYMADIRADITPDTIPQLCAAASAIAPMEYDLFTIFNGIDGAKNPNREVALVVADPGTHEQHSHPNSNATLFITEGSGLLTNDDEAHPVKAGDVIAVPKGTPHGFEVPEGGQLKFISVQSPPIVNHETGVIDIKDHKPAIDPVRIRDIVKDTRRAGGM